MQVITEKDELRPGDKAEFVYDMSGTLWMQAYQLGKIEDGLNSDGRWKYRGYTILHEDGSDRRLAFKIDVVSAGKIPEQLRAGFRVPVKAITAVILSTGLITWMALREVRLIYRAPTDQAKAEAISGAVTKGLELGTLAIITAILFGLGIIKK